MLTKAKQFKELLQSNHIEFLLEAHNGVSAKIVEETGFKGIWGSGLSISAALGVRDNNEASWTQVLDVIEFMSDATTIPILLDADTGYGNFNNVRRLVRKLEQRQVAAMCIEDKLFPKTNSFIGGEKQPLADMDEFAGKIKAAKDTQQDPNFSVVARLEAFIVGWGLSEALKRAESYFNAGADALLVHSKLSNAEEVLSFMNEWQDTCPVIIVPTMYYQTPTTVFEKAGVDVVIWANHLMRSSITAMQQNAKKIYEEKSSKSIEPAVVSVQEIFRLQNADELKAAETVYLPTNSELSESKHEFKSNSTKIESYSNENKKIAHSGSALNLPQGNGKGNGGFNAEKEIRNVQVTEGSSTTSTLSVDTESPYAIVIGLDCMTGLQTARLLAAHEVPIIGMASDPDHFSCRTKVCKKIVTTNTSSTALIRTLQSLGPTLKQKAVLVPCIDTSVLLISRHRQELENWFHVLLPQEKVVEMLMDKVGFYKFAKESGLPVPGTILIHNKEQAETASKILTFPCILKPPYKSPTWEKNTKSKAYKVADVKEFLELYDRCSKWAQTLIVQEWVEGRDSNLYSCNCYFNKSGEPLVTFTARKLRQWPPETGTSSLGEEVRDDLVEKETIRLFKSVNYRGLGYVEMKRDERTGKYYIIEPNIGRPTGRSAIAEAGGVELLYTMYCDAIGRPLPENRKQQYTGVKWVYWRRDFQSAWHYWRRGQLSLKDLRKSWRGKKACAVFSWTDPAPFLADWRNKGGQLLKGGKRHRKSKDLSHDHTQ